MDPYGFSLWKPSTWTKRRAKEISPPPSEDEVVASRPAQPHRCRRTGQQRLSSSHLESTMFAPQKQVVLCCFDGDSSRIKFINIHQIYLFALKSWSWFILMNLDRNMIAMCLQCLNFLSSRSLQPEKPMWCQILCMPGTSGHSKTSKPRGCSSKCSTSSSCPLLGSSRVSNLRPKKRVSWGIPTPSKTLTD